MRALCRRLMRPRLQLGMSIVVTLFTAFAWWLSHWGASESALFAAMIGVTAYYWKVVVLRQTRDEDQP